MAGNSSRRGAVRKSGSKKGSTVGSGGKRRKGLEGKGPTPKAIDRKNSPAQKAAKRASAKATTTTRGRAAAAPLSRRRDTSDIVVGRNPVVEALRASVPASKLHVATGIEYDDRVREMCARALGLIADPGHIDHLAPLLERYASLTDAQRHDLAPMHRIWRARAGEPTRG